MTTSRAQPDPVFGLPLPLLAAVLGGTIYALYRGASAMEALLVLLGGAVIIKSVTWWFKHPPLVHRYTPRLGRWLRIALPAKAAWQPPQVVERQVYLPITNEGGTAAFSATVERIEGTADSLALPFAVRWRDQQDERLEVATRETRLLYLARVEPEGNVADYPIEHGASTKNSVERRVKNWKPVRCRFMGMGQEYVVYLDLDDLPPLTRTLRLERYERRIRVSVRLRSSDGAVNEAKTVGLGIREVDDSRHSWGAKDAVVAAFE